MRRSATEMACISLLCYPSLKCPRPTNDVSGRLGGTAVINDTNFAVAMQKEDTEYEEQPNTYS